MDKLFNLYFKKVENNYNKKIAPLYIFSSCILIKPKYILTCLCRYIVEAKPIRKRKSFPREENLEPFK